MNSFIFCQTWTVSYNVFPFNIAANLFEISNKNYIISVSGSNIENYESWEGMIKIDKKGKIIEQKKLTNSNYYFDLILKTEFLTYILWGQDISLGYGKGKIIIAEMDENFNFIWHKEYDFHLLKDEYLSLDDIKEIEDGFLITGHFYGSTNKKSFIMKISKDGNLIWIKNCSSLDLYFPAVSVDGFIYLSGSNYEDGIILIVDKDLNIIEQKAYNIKDASQLIPDALNGATIMFKDNGNLIIYGGARFFNSFPFTYIIEKNSNGEILWKKGFIETYSEIISIEKDGSIIFHADAPTPLPRDTYFQTQMSIFNANVSTIYEPNWPQYFYIFKIDNL